MASTVLPPTFVITPVHNRRPVTTAFVRRLAQQSLKPTFVLVDDGSTDGTAEAVTSIYPSVVLRGDGSLWWAGGLQKGLNCLKGRGIPEESIVAFMNDDTDFDDDYLEKAVIELVALGPGAFLSVPGIFHPSGRRSEEAVVCDWSRFRFRDYGRHPERIDCCSTRSLFMRWGDLRTVGGFHPTTLPHYISDFEFTIRARRKGVRIHPAKTVAARFDDLLTGNHETRGLPLAAKIRLLLSPRFSFNPVTMFVFVWYAAPLVWKGPCWVRIALSVVKFLK